MHVVEAKSNFYQHRPWRWKSNTVIHRPWWSTTVA